MLCSAIDACCVHKPVRIKYNWLYVHHYVGGNSKVRAQTSQVDTSAALFPELPPILVPPKNCLLGGKKLLKHRQGKMPTKMVKWTLFSEFRFINDNIMHALRRSAKYWLKKKKKTIEVFLVSSKWLGNRTYGFIFPDPMGPGMWFSLNFRATQHIVGRPAWHWELELRRIVAGMGFTIIKWVLSLVLEVQKLIIVSVINYGITHVCAEGTSSKHLGCQTRLLHSPCLILPEIT